jgi:hypothetical protein
MYIFTDALRQRDTQWMASIRRRLRRTGAWTKRVSCDWRSGRSKSSRYSKVTLWDTLTVCTRNGTLLLLAFALEMSEKRILQANSALTLTITLCSHV